MPRVGLTPFSSGRVGFGSFLRLVSANELAAKREEQARRAEAARVPRRDAQLIGDLTKREAEATQSLHRGEAVEATIAVRMFMELVHKGKLAIAPGPHFG